MVLFLRGSCGRSGKKVSGEGGGAVPQDNSANVEQSASGGPGGVMNKRRAMPSW